MIKKINGILSIISGSRQNTLVFEPENTLNRFYTSDEKFVSDVYLKILRREQDQEGFRHHIGALRGGMKKIEMLKDIVQSEEFLHIFITMNVKPLQNLIILKKENYFITENNHIVYDIKEKEDFDWLEKKILENGYYERCGVWTYEINQDSRTMAKIISFFQPKLALEIGCAFGCVMKCLCDMGINCDGVELSKFAKEMAYSDIKDNIRIGDLLSTDLNINYDLIFALDLFEHLNPNKLKNYLSKIYDLLNNGGYVFINVPVFGDDPIFGNVFQLYIEEWKNDFINTKIFSKLHVDDQGYPINGHLIWAGSNWWVDQFEQSGFQREIEIEKAIHVKYDELIEKTSVARKTFYIFSKNKDIDRVKTILDNILMEDNKDDK